MKKSNSLAEIYPFDPQTQAYTIPVRLSRYSDLFNPMDPSPVPARDLSLKLADYLEQCSAEIPLKFPLTIALQIQHDARDPLSEEECRGSLRSFYQHAIFLTRAQISRKRRKALNYFLISIACLALYIFSGTLNLAGFLWNLLHEAILIGGWVFMWEAVTVNFIEMDEPSQAVQKFQRLIQAQVLFDYTPVQP